MKIVITALEIEEIIQDHFAKALLPTQFAVSSAEFIAHSEDHEIEIDCEIGTASDGAE